MDRFAVFTPKLHVRMRRQGTPYPTEELTYFPLVIGREKYCDTFLVYHQDGTGLSHVEMIDAGMRTFKSPNAQSIHGCKNWLDDLEDIARKFNPGTTVPVHPASGERPEELAYKVWRIPASLEMVDLLEPTLPAALAEMVFRPRLNKDIRQILSPIDVQGLVKSWREPLQFGLEPQFEFEPLQFESLDDAESSEPHSPHPGHAPEWMESLDETNRSGYPIPVRETRQRRGLKMTRGVSPLLAHRSCLNISSTDHDPIRDTGPDDCRFA